MYDEIKRHYDSAAAKGDAVRELVWLGKHTDAVDEEADRYVADRYADAEGRALFHREHDPYARHGLGGSDDCLHDVEMWYAFLWAELDCRTVDRVTAAYRDEAALHGITLPADDEGIRMLADRHDVWAVIRG